jgi:hypothetical protein
MEGKAAFRALSSIGDDPRGAGETHIGGKGVSRQVDFRGETGVGALRAVIS